MQGSKTEVPSPDKKIALNEIRRYYSSAFDEARLQPRGYYQNEANPANQEAVVGQYCLQSVSPSEPLPRNTSPNKRKLTQSVHQKGSKEEQISNILKVINPPAYVFGAKKSEGKVKRHAYEGAPNLIATRDTEQYKQNRPARGQTEISNSHTEQSFNRDADYRRQNYVRDLSKPILHQEVTLPQSEQSQIYVSGLSNLAQIMPPNTGKAIKEKIFQNYKQKLEHQELRRKFFPQMQGQAVISLRDSQENIKNALKMASQDAFDNPLGRVNIQKIDNSSNQLISVSKVRLSEHQKPSQLNALQQSQSAIRINNRLPDYFDFDEQLSVPQKTPFYQGSQTKIKVKPKQTAQPEKSIYVLETKDSKSVELLNSSSVIALRPFNSSNARTNITNHQSMSEVPQLNPDVSGLSLPHIGRQAQQRFGSQERVREPLPFDQVQVDDIYVRRQQKEQANNFNRAFKINQLNALTNKRIKQKLERLVLQQAINQPIAILVKPVRKGESSQLGERESMQRQQSQPDLVSPMEKSVQNEDIELTLEEQTLVTNLSQTQNPADSRQTMASKYSLSGTNQEPFTITSQRQFSKQAQPMNDREINEVLQHLISDLQRLNPDFSALSPEQQSTFLYQNLVKLQQQHYNPSNPRKSADSPTAMLNFLSPMHIINHYNITINHQPKPEEPTFKYSQGVPQSRNNEQDQRRSVNKGGDQLLTNYLPEENKSQDRDLSQFHYILHERQRSENRIQNILNSAIKEKLQNSLSPEVKKHLINMTVQAEKVRVQEMEATIKGVSRVVPNSNASYQQKRLDPLGDTLLQQKVNERSKLPGINQQGRQKNKIQTQNVSKMNLDVEQTNKKIQRLASTGSKIDPDKTAETLLEQSTANDNALVPASSKVNYPLTEDASPIVGPRKAGFVQEQSWGQNKRGVPNQQIYTEQLRIRLDFQEIDEPDCALYASRNECCRKIRDRQQPQEKEELSKKQPKKQQPKRAETEMPKATPKSNILDLLIVSFDGVIGTFISHPDSDPTKTLYEQMILRQGVQETLAQLAEKFQIAIVVDYEQASRLMTVKKALKNAPYDRIYRKVAQHGDNFFNIENIIKDSDVDESRVLFLSACMFTGKSLIEKPAPNGYDIHRAVINHMTVNATAKADFGLMPVALNLESIVMFMVPHILVEVAEAGANLEVLFKTESQINTETILQVSQFSAFAQPILSLHQITLTLTKQNTKQLRKAETFNLSAHSELVQNAKGKNLKQTNGQHSHSSESDTESHAPDKTKKLDEAASSNHTRFDPAQVPKTRFRILTEINDYELFHPISRYLKTFQPQQSGHSADANKGKRKKPNKEITFVSDWKENVFCRAFNKIKHLELANSLFFQPERFNREILGGRLQPVMIKIKLKLKKIQQALKIVSALTLKQKGMTEEEKTKEFLQNRQRNDKLRHQVAFAAFNKYIATYFQEVYEECLVRMPLHPTREQLIRLQQAYKTIYQRLMDLITQKYKTGKEWEQSTATQNAIIKQRLKNSGIEDIESRLQRTEDPFLAAFARHVAFMAQQNKSTVSYNTREAYPYSLILLQSQALAQGPLVKAGRAKRAKLMVHRTYFQTQAELLQDGSDRRPQRDVVSLIEWMCESQRPAPQKQVTQQANSEQEANEQHK